MNMMYFLCTCLLSFVSAVKCENIQRCDQLQVGQYTCDDANIDDDTQEIEGCRKDGFAAVCCRPRNGINCSGRIHGVEFLDKAFNGSEVGFEKYIPCRYTNGYSYYIAVSLSLFLGWLGFDRFYLGYPAIGILKFCTFGFCGIGALVDFLLISVQVILPSDGSNYVIDRYGPRLFQVYRTDDTFYKS